MQPKRSPWPLFFFGVGLGLVALAVPVHAVFGPSAALPLWAVGVTLVMSLFVPALMPLR